MQNLFRNPSPTDDGIIDFAYEIYVRVGKPANLTFRQWLEAEARELEHGGGPPAVGGLPAGGLAQRGGVRNRARL